MQLCVLRLREIGNINFNWENICVFEGNNTHSIEWAVTLIRSGNQLNLFYQQGNIHTSLNKDCSPNRLCKNPGLWRSWAIYILNIMRWKMKLVIILKALFQFGKRPIKPSWGQPTTDKLSTPQDLLLVFRLSFNINGQANEFFRLCFFYQWWTS